MPSLPQSPVLGRVVITIPQLLELGVGDGEKNGAPIMQKEVVSDLPCHLDTHKPMGSDGIHPRIAKELAKPIFILYQQSWLTGDVPAD